MENKQEGLNIYTDLAIEIAETLTATVHDSGIEGVEVETEENEDGNIKVTNVIVQNEAGSKQMGKPIGRYITVESQEMKTNDIDLHEEIIKILSQKLAEICNIKKNETVLIIGLGNWNVTPDALGPKVVSKVLVTRHIIDSLPKQIDNSVRPVCALSPGVMGLTGIETAEVVKGLVDKIKPSLVIAIDALAARKTSRINATIQMTDTGVSPGAGMGNNRMVLNEKTLGVPVVAIGVPTVVDAATLVNDTLDLMLASMKESMHEDMAAGQEFFDMLSGLEEQEKYGIIKESLDPYAGNMFVTPKEVGEVVGWLSNMIANSINIALHPGIDQSDINRFMY